MGFKLTDIAINDKHDHPAIPGRVVARVRAVLAESQPGYAQEHVLLVRVYAERRPDRNEADLDHELMMRAASILERVRARLDDRSRSVAG